MSVFRAESYIRLPPPTGCAIIHSDWCARRLDWRTEQRSLPGAARTMGLEFRFWGVRGSTPTPGRQNLRYGGNTPCIEVQTKSKNLFILDCGSGFRALGNILAKRRSRKPIQAHIFLTHFHWDHIQGIPFFRPLYDRRNKFLIHGPPFQHASLQDALEGQMIDPYFPVNMNAMAAQRSFHQIGEENHMQVEDLMICTKQLNHPQGCLGYRLECDGRVVVYATDNEPGDAEGDRNVRLLAEGADILIYDGQYTPEEMKTHRNWGHSNWKEGIRIARECKVKRLVLFHHDPDRDDRALDRLQRRARDHFDDVVAAREGLLLKP